METLKKFFAVAAIVCSTVLTAQPANNKSIESVFSESYNSEMQGEFVKAINSLKSVYDEKNYMINARLGWLYYLNSEFKTSLEYYRKAIAISPGAIEARFGYCIPASSLDMWDDVLAQYDAILKIDAANTLALYRSGMIFYNRKDYKKAKEYFSKVTSLYPFDYDSQVMLGWTQLMLDKKAESRDAFRAALIIRPNDVSATEGLKKASN